MKRQGIILLLALWGILAFPIGYLHELGDDKVIRLWGWLQSSLGAAMFWIVWGWFGPALSLAKLLGISDRLYGQEILPYPKIIYGWLLPILCWYAIFNLIALIKRK
jgi:hypothetical protein